MSMTGPERRRQRSEERLREALARLIAGAGQGAAKSSPDALSVASLSRASGIGRNAIYTNHRFALDELARAREAAAGETAVRRDRLAELRAETDRLKLDKSRLATENAGLLARLLEAEGATASLRRQVETLQQALKRLRDASTPPHQDIGMRRE